MIREVCSKYFYDQCPAVAGYGEWPTSLLFVLFGPHPRQHVEAPKSLSSRAWLPGSSCSENLSQQLPASLPRCLHQCPTPAR